MPCHSCALALGLYTGHMMNDLIVPLYIVLWKKGRVLVWDVTCVSSHISYKALVSSEAGAVENNDENHKNTAILISLMLLFSWQLTHLGPWIMKGVLCCLVSFTGDPQSRQFPYNKWQHLSSGETQPLLCLVHNILW